MRRALHALLAVLLSACQPSARAPGTVVMASGTDLESGNPLVTVHTLSRQVQRHALFVTLVRLDSLLQPEPYYARAWTWSPDHRAVTFHLDSALRWHDGAPTTARDVAFTYRMARDSALGSPRRGEAMAIDSVVATDAYTVRVVLATARATLPPVLAELPLVPAHLLDSVPTARWRQHPFATAPVGNGPFRFASRLAGRQWRFVRNADFPASMGGPPALRALVVAVVDEAATKFAGLVSGELDLAGVSPTMARLVQRDSTLALETPPALFSTVLALNTTRAPLNEARVRQAIALCLDRARIVAAAVAGFGTPAISSLPPGLPVSPSPATETAADRAAANRRADSLLDAAGWLRGPDGVRVRDGRRLSLELLTVGSGEMAIEQLVQADLAARGIGLTLRVLELATFLSTVRAPQKTFDLAITGIPGDIALGHLSAMFSTEQRGGALDYTGFHAASLDTALATARGAAPTEAAAAWARVDQRLQADAPVVWIYHARGVQGRSRALQGVRMDLRGELTTVARWTRP
ncbi:MAG: peptide ABC transporter substrate-binding protein [Gemmatimonadaceae bacterium]|nr:peptide ABC transporter substrate-binding protein [Gemmatimonadaceae bacterium]